MKCFQAKKVQRSHTISLAATPERVFPLLCPVREEEWVPGWEHESYELIFSKSGFNEEGCIFKTKFKSPDDSVWTCLKFDRENWEVEFLVHVVGLQIRKFTILLKPTDDHSTNAKFLLSATALSERGNQFVEKLTEAEYVKFISGFEMMLNYYFRHGVKMPVNK